MSLWRVWFRASWLVILCLHPPVFARDQLPEPFYLYRDYLPGQELPYIPSGWMGDWGDLTLELSDEEHSHTGKTCLKVVYSAKAAQNYGWAGMFWQRPANNWGDKNAGLDLTGARQLTFFARGASGGETLDKVQVGGIQGRFSDSCEAHVGPITLTTAWREYRLALEGKDLSSLIGAFAWVASKTANPQGFTIYFDDIRFE